VAVDTVIPIVFPDYLIGVNTPPVEIPVPDVLPGMDIFPNVVRISATKNKLPELGHAGVLFIQGSSGTTKYFEYGRYHGVALGLAHRVPVPDVTKQGRVFSAVSLARCLHTVCLRAGQGSRLEGAYIEVPGKFGAMLQHANKQVSLNTDPKRTPYDLVSHSCVHFMRAVVEAADVDTPYMIDPRPNSYIGELRSAFHPIDYWPATRRLKM
jgi:hypothetical protein